jgi:glutamate:GABA antiporter
MSATGPEVEQTTAMALQEKAKLVKSLRRMDMILFSICALVGVDTLGTVAGYGAEAFTWLIVLAVLFLFPYALLMSELGSTFRQEGGPYEWMKMSFGRLTAGIGAVLYWVTNPLWVGGSLAFVATAGWSTLISPIGTQTFGDYLFKLLFIWISITVAIMALRQGKWIPNAGAIARFVLIAFFSLTVLIYAIKHGVHGYSAGDFKPSSAGFMVAVAVLLFNYVGFELQNGAAEEMQNPQKDVPVSVIRSGIISVICYAIPIFGIFAVLPSSQISGIDGFASAIQVTFGVYGGAANFLGDVFGLLFILALVTSGAVWMIGSDRIQAVAAYDGAFLPWFGSFNAKLGTPVRVNVMSGVVATIFMFAAEQFSTGSNANTFTVVLYISITTTLISYLFIFPAGVMLRRKRGHVDRPYRVPGGEWGMWVCAALTTFWVALGSWAAVFPGTIDHYVLGLHYSMQDNWGVSRARFETFTLGTLAVIVVFAVVGYALGGEVRRREVTVPLDTGLEPATGD